MRFCKREAPTRGKDAKIVASGLNAAKKRGMIYYTIIGQGGKGVPAIGYYNGTFGDPDTMTVPMNDRAVYFGDGCYEACLVIGTKAFRLEAHIDRFCRSLAALSIPFFSDRDFLTGVLDRCIRIANEPCAVLYWQASRATAPRTHAFPKDAAPNLLVTVRPKTLLPRERTLKLITADDIRYAMCDVKTLNLIPNILANQRAKEAGADEAVFVRDGCVTEGSHTNIHILKKGTLITHPTDNRILAGVTRAALLEAAKENGVPVLLRAFTKDEMTKADEVLVTSSTLGVRRAETVDGAAVGGKAEALYETLLRSYERSFMRETRA